MTIWMRTCKTCGVEKECNSAAKRGSVLSGFMGRDCWDCYLVKARLRHQELIDCPVTGELVSRSTAVSRKLVDDPNGSGEKISYSTAYARKLVDDPNGTGEKVAYGAAQYRKLVDDPNNSGEKISRSAAYRRRLVDDPNGTGEQVSRNVAYNRRLVDDPNGTSEKVSYTAAYARKLVDDPNGTGERVSYGAAAKRKLVDDPNGSGEKIAYGTAQQRRLLATPEGRAYIIDATCRYHDRKLENTGILDKEDQDLTLQTIREISSYDLTVDHIIPVTLGGQHAWWNLNGLTSFTNQSKFNKPLFEPGEVDCWLDMRALGLPIDTYELLVRAKLGYPLLKQA